MTFLYRPIKNVGGTYTLGIVPPWPGPLVENGTCLLLSVAKTAFDFAILDGLYDQPHLHYLVLVQAFAAAGVIEAIIGVQWVLQHTLYATIPKRHDFTNGFRARDLLLLHAPISVLSSAFMVYALPQPRSYPTLAEDLYHTSAVRVCLGMTVFRLVHDALFYAFHRAMHAPRLFWAHARHHEHKFPSS